MKGNNSIQLGQVFRAAAVLRLAWALAAPAVGFAGEMATLRIGTAQKLPVTARPKPKVQEPPTGYVVQAPSRPKIDGDLGDDAWKAAETLRLDRTLDGMARAVRPTEVKLLRDERNLYVAFRCDEPKLDGMQVRQRARDGQVWADDCVEVFLSCGDGYYHFIVNPAGSSYDGRGKSAGWNCGFAAATGRQRRAWTAEMALPLKPMTGADVPTRWKANFNRTRRAAGSAQESAWSPTYSGDSHVPGRFGTLIFGSPPAPKPRAEVPAPPTEGKPVAVLRTPQGEGLVRFDLSALPDEAKVVRADLLVFRSAPLTGASEAAMVDIEIYPVYSEVAPGTTPKVDGTPLALRSPWYDRFDATEAVKQWVEGKTNGGFYVAACPDWCAEATCLDVAYEGKGKPEAMPPQVTGVKVFHRAGQTFITWREVDPLITEEEVTYGQYKRALAEAEAPCRYRVYTHEEPITAQTLSAARLLAEVGPLSAYNVNARNKEYLIGRAMIRSDEMGELARHYNGEMHRWTPDSPRMDRYPLKRFVIDEQAGPLPPGTGLYVHNPLPGGRKPAGLQQAPSGKLSYYAVVSVRNGVENTKDIGAGNAPPAPVKETVGVGVPVRQGKGLWGPYFDFPGTRWVYVQWCAPPLSPRPNMYFNWSVLIPPGSGDPDTPVLPGMESSARVPAELYFHPEGYSYAQPGKKVMLASIQIAPHDWPASGWYGFNDAYGTLKSFRRGKVSNHTQKRIIAFLEWAKKTFPIDPDQVVCAGADGAAALALNYPDVFAYVWVTGFDSAVLDPKAAPKFAAAWGPKSPEITDDMGRGEWRWANLDELALAQSNDLPLFVCYGYSWGADKGYAKGNGRFYRAMLQARQPLMAYWGWSGARNRGLVDKYHGTWHGKRITRNTPIPAFSKSSRDHDRESSGIAGGGFQWKQFEDEKDRLSVTILGGGKGTFDLTMRRLRNFKARPGEELRWQTTCLPGRRGEKAEDQSSTVIVDAKGLITINGLTYADGIGGLTVTVTRAE